MQPFELKPIGYVRTAAEEMPRHWSRSDVIGEVVIDEAYHPGLADIRRGDRIVVLFGFHKSPPFENSLLFQTPPGRRRPRGVFSICSPRRPNPIGLSVLEVLDVRKNVLSVKGLDMFDGTPVFDIKPHIENGKLP
jgi:tRNA-Thr(GGU) m(6)t(6)A37 methyltransferase TsaA